MMPLPLLSAACNICGRVLGWDHLGFFKCPGCQAELWPQIQETREALPKYSDERFTQQLMMPENFTLDGKHTRSSGSGHRRVKKRSDHYKNFTEV